MWLVEAWGVERFRAEIAARMGEALRDEVHVQYESAWERRDVMGVHPQAQPGLSWVGVVIPAGRMFAADFDDFAAVAEK